MPIGKGGFGMNKSVFVTGGTSGTGLAIAERFAKENYNVFIGSRSAESAQAAACEINKKYGVFSKGYGYRTDTLNTDETEMIFDDIKSNK